MTPSTKIDSPKYMHVYIDYLHEQLKNHHNPSFQIMDLTLKTAPFVDGRSFHGDKKLLQHAINLRYLRCQRLQRRTLLNGYELRILHLKRARDLIKKLSRATIVNLDFDNGDFVSSFTYFLPHQSLRRIYLFVYPRDIQIIISNYLIKHH